MPFWQKKANGRLGCIRQSVASGWSEATIDRSPLLSAAEATSGCAVSIPGEIQKLPGRGSQQPALGDPA